jgi:ABC-type branched-subunit amino acid transport system ATPase component
MSARKSRVILFINGPFGVGKTTVANLLAERMPDAMLYDPEIVGAFLRYVLAPVEKVDDFQDYALWPAMVVEVAQMLKDEYRGTLIMPMTVWRREYFEKLTDDLKRVTPELRCFRLTASEDVLNQRILSRPDEEGSHEWCLSHLTVGLAASQDPAFGVEIPTDNRAPAEVANAIMGKLTC